MVIRFRQRIVSICFKFVYKKTQIMHPLFLHCHAISLKPGYITLIREKSQHAHLFIAYRASPTLGLRPIMVSS